MPRGVLFGDIPAKNSTLDGAGSEPATWVDANDGSDGSPIGLGAPEHALVTIAAASAVHRPEKDRNANPTLIMTSFQ
jgi:hypothetical protein